MVSLVVSSALVYGALGALFAVPFVWLGVGRVDPAAARGTLGFRLLILPGTVAFWPLLAWRWIRATSELR